MITRRRKSKKWIIRLVFVALIVGAAITGFLLWKNYSKSESDEGDKIAETTEELKKSSEKDLGTSETPETVEEKKTILYEGDDPNKKTELTGVITYAEVSGDFLMVRINIDQYLSRGQCKLDLIRDGVIVHEEEAAIINSAATATCEGFNIPSNSLDTGDYKIVIKLSSDMKEGMISGEVKI